MLGIGALVFLFPFYYMFIGSLQTEPDPTPAGAFPNPGNLTLGNYAAIDSRISLVGGLINSGIFTGGVLLCTVVFGVLAGYALAILEWRGAAFTFAPGAAGPGRAVPAADRAAVRADRPQLRPG